MQIVPAEYLQALESSHSILVRADVRKGRQRLYTSLPVSAGTIDVDASRVTRRTCDLVVPPRLPVGTYGDMLALPEKPGDPLATNGQEVSVQHGLVYPNGVVGWVQVGVFRIDDVEGSLIGQEPVAVSGVSREAWIADDRFEAPRTVSSTSAVVAIRDLIRETLPRAEVVVLTERDRRVWPTTFEEDRWGAVVKIAESIGCQVYADPWGRFVIADLPTLDSEPVWRMSNATNLTSARTRQSRERVYNKIVVRGATPEGADQPVWAKAVDDVRGSATRYGDPDSGRWGKSTMFMPIPTLTTPWQCFLVAQTQLAQRTGRREEFNLTAVPNAALEANDVVSVVADERRAYETLRRHVVDRFTLPLVAGGQFPVVTRDVGQVGTDMEGR